jgi:hypothetical protein
MALAFGERDISCHKFAGYCVFMRDSSHPCSAADPWLVSSVLILAALMLSGRRAIKQDYIHIVARLLQGPSLPRRRLPSEDRPLLPR